VDATGLAGWLADGAAGLVAAVRAAGPGTPVWTWSTDRTVGFWLRRMAHDLLLILNRRLPVGGTGGEVTGDRTVLQWWLDGSVF